MMIKREVFDKMIKAYPDFYIKQLHVINGKPIERPHMWNFFDTLHDPKSKTYMGEDFAFCKRWRDIGGSCHAWVMDQIIHVGEHQYAGRFGDEFGATAEGAGGLGGLLYQGGGNMQQLALEGGKTLVSGMAAKKYGLGGGLAAYGGLSGLQGAAGYGVGGEGLTGIEGAKSAFMGVPENQLIAPPPKPPGLDNYNS
jgi:hypothetical protein